MKTRKSILGLSILASGLSFVGSARAIDVLTNGSFETARTAPNAAWQYFDQYNHVTQAYYSGPDIPASENPGTYYSWQQADFFSNWGHYTTPTNLAAFMQFGLAYSCGQTASLTNAIAGNAIDAGLGRYTFSSWLASYDGNPEQPLTYLRFYDVNTNPIAGNDAYLDRTTNTYAVSYAAGFPNNPPPADLSQDHNWVKYVRTGTVPANARFARVWVTRSFNADLHNSPDTYIDLVKLDVVNINDNTFLETTTPGSAPNVSPDAVVNINLRDVNNVVVTNSIQFTFDNVTVAPTIQKSGTLTTIQYDPPGLLAAGSAHQYKVIWTDNGSPATTKTNQYAFTVAPYFNIVGTPIYQETFDGVAEGSLPAGWTVSNSTDSDLPGADLNNFHSDTYQNWVVISRSTLSNLVNVVPGGTDYKSVTNVAPLQFVNDAPVTNLISGNFALAASSSRFGNQVQNLFTGDYNLSGHANVYLVFKDIFTQNQDSMGAVEYSINGGATWLPALYMIQASNIKIDSRGNLDASNTLATTHTSLPGGASYGSFVGLDQSQWASAAPFISPRTDDDLFGSHRVEAIRLAQADNQTTVRFRINQTGSDSYYFGIEDFSLYSLTITNPPVLTTSPVATTVAAGSAATLTSLAIGVAPLSYQWRLNGSNISTATGPIMIIPIAHASDAGNYDVVVTGGGISVTSAVVQLTVINPAMYVTGQWDFKGNLAATVGNDLQYYDATVAADSTFGTTGSFGISDINGQSTTVMHLNPSIPAWGGYKMFHGSAANGGGARVNQYTLIYDIYYPGGSDGTYRAFLQTSTNNADDADLFANPGDGIGITSIYDGVLTPDTWHRVAFAFDLSGPGVHPVLTKFIDGVKVAEQTAGLSGTDGRFALLSYALLIADNDGDNAEAYISSIQFSNGRRPDEFIQALGGPSAAKIPGTISATKTNGATIVSWPGGVPLQGADVATGPYTNIVGATSPYTVPNGTTTKFFRPKIP